MDGSASSGTTSSVWSCPRQFFHPTSGIVLFTQGSITYRFPHGEHPVHSGDVLVLPRGIVYSGEKQMNVKSFIVFDFETALDSGREIMGLPTVFCADEETTRLIFCGAE